MENQTQIFGIRAIIEAINAGETIDKVFLQKGERGELFSELESLLNKKSINRSYVPIEKLNRLTKKNHHGAVAQISPIAFHDMETLVINLLESGKTPLFLLSLLQKGLYSLIALGFYLFYLHQKSWHKKIKSHWNLFWNRPAKDNS